MAINQAVISGKIAMQLSDETMEQVATIQQLRERSNHKQPTEVARHAPEPRSTCMLANINEPINKAQL
jgi:hypothetical protein